MIAGGTEIVTRLLHADGRLYGIPFARGSGLAGAGIVIDTDGAATNGEGPNVEERGFYIDEDGVPWQTRGVGEMMVEETGLPRGFRTAVQHGAWTWSAEFCIDKVGSDVAGPTGELTHEQPVSDGPTRQFFRARQGP